MIIIKNKGKDVIKSYSVKLTNDKVAIEKTQKDFPISDTIEIEVGIEELGDIYSANINLVINYENGKKHSVSAVNYDPIICNLDITTFGSDKKLRVNSNAISGVARKDVVSENFKIIQSLVNTYMENHHIGESTATNGKDGKDGASAYEVAKKLGYTGTEAQWVASLKGVKGDKGDKGATGETGKNGTNGKDGVGIKNITKTSTSGYIDTYTITYTDESTSTFTVTNGKNGVDGKDGKDGVSESGSVEELTKEEILAILNGEA